MDIVFKLVIYVFMCDLNFDSNTKVALNCIPKFQYNKFEIASTDSTESFKEFYFDFFNERDFQVNRIVFPLKYVVLNDDNSYRVFYKSRSKWKFSSLEDKGLIVKTLKNNKTEVVINYQISDTGFYANYYFKKINGIWFLYKIYDESWKFKCSVLSP
jgi:hypothetical protein